MKRMFCLCLLVLGLIFNWTMVYAGDFYGMWFVPTSDCEVRSGPGAQYKIVKKIERFSRWSIPESFRQTRTPNSLEWYPIKEDRNAGAQLVEGWLCNDGSLRMRAYKVGEIVSFIRYEGEEEIIQDGAVKRHLGKKRKIDGSIYEKAIFEVYDVKLRYPEWVKRDCGRVFFSENNMYEFIGNQTGTESYAKKYNYDVREKCACEWPDDFKMQKHCVEMQESARIKLNTGKPYDVPQNVFNKIRAKCQKDWPDDYKMRLHCEKEQTKAWRELYK